MHSTAEKRLFFHHNWQSIMITLVIGCQSKKLVKKTCCSLLLKKITCSAKREKKIICRDEKIPAPHPRNIKWSIPNVHRNLVNVSVCVHFYKSLFRDNLGHHVKH